MKTDLELMFFKVEDIETLMDILERYQDMFPTLESERKVIKIFKQEYFELLRKKHKRGE